MTTTRLFKNGNSQAVRIPAELAFSSSDMELLIERVGDELRIRPAQRRMGNVMKAPYVCTRTSYQMLRLAQTRCDKMAEFCGFGS